MIETALAQEFQRYAHVAGQDRLAAANDDRRDEQVILVDEPGANRVSGQGAVHILHGRIRNPSASVAALENMGPPV